MNITLINTSDTGGGAPIACRRLMNALNAGDVDSRMLVQQKHTDLATVKPVLTGTVGKLIAEANFLRERIPFILHERDKSVRFAFSEANCGTDISRDPLVRNADILHLHWTNRGFLSIKNLKQILDMNKPVVWTLHDMWSFTGGCHYTGGCNHFLNQCGYCPMLKNPNEQDLSSRGWIRKSRVYQDIKNLNIVTCSRWLADAVKASSLLGDFPVQTIPNPIDTAVYCELDRQNARKKWNIDPEARVLLFGAANINDKRKGLEYLLQAMEYQKQTSDPPLELIMFGKNKSFDHTSLPCKVHMLPLISSEQDLIELYSLADIFVHPSLEDNLPNMVMEAMSCSTPVVAFNTGGLADLVEHKVNGYLAEYRSAEDFSRGISWILSPEQSEIRKLARLKVESNFTNSLVASQYKTLYSSILNKHV